MSTGLECSITEEKPGEWYYVLQDGNCPVQCWDWREYATAYGPFPSLDAAHDHLQANHANPGGFWSQEYVTGYKPDEVMAKLIAEAPENTRSLRRGPRGSSFGLGSHTLRLY